MFMSLLMLSHYLINEPVTQHTTRRNKTIPFVPHSMFILYVRKIKNMKKTILILLTIVICSFALNASYLRNGDFQGGSSGWKGDRNVDHESEGSENKILMIEMENDDQTIFQEIKLKREKDLSLTFKVQKSSDYVGRGFSIRFTRKDGSYNFYNRSVKKNGWNNFKIRFSDINGSRKLKLSIIVRSGKAGHLSFDDFQITSK
jgi:hypothetical protein